MHRIRYAKIFGVKNTHTASVKLDIKAREIALENIATPIAKTQTADTREKHKNIKNQKNHKKTSIYSI